MSSDASKAASDFLLHLAHGNYDRELCLVDEVLQVLGATMPAALIAKKALDAFIIANRQTAPDHVVPDGMEGWVPSTNSRIGPDGQFLVGYNRRPRK